MKYVQDVEGEVYEVEKQSNFVALININPDELATAEAGNDVFFIPHYLFALGLLDGFLSEVPELEDDQW